MLSKADHEAREYRVTASTLAEFLGFHAYSSPSQAWDYHTGAIPFPESDNTRLGQLIEPGLVQFAAWKLGWKEYAYPCGTRVSTEYPWAAATPDCLHPSGTMGIQTKNQNFHMAKFYLGRPRPGNQADNDLLPAYMNSQCQWEMMVMGANRWYLGTYFGGNNFPIYKIWRDQAMLDLLIPRAHAFWKQHIDPDGPRTRPTDENWNPTVGKKKPKKLSREEILAAPIQAFK